VYVVCLWSYFLKVKHTKLFASFFWKKNAKQILIIFYDYIIFIMLFNYNNVMHLFSFFFKKTCCLKNIHIIILYLIYLLLCFFPFVWSISLINNKEYVLRIFFWQMYKNINHFEASSLFVLFILCFKYCQTDMVLNFY